MLIIGITGKKRVGKNYVANLAQEQLEQKFGFTVRQMSFAQPLKEICKILFGINDEQLAGDKSGLCWERWEELNEYQEDWHGSLKQFGLRKKVDNGDGPYEFATGQLTVREALQLVGTDLFRDCWSKTIWTRIAARKIEEAEAAGVDAVIFTDVRFPNEAATIEGMGGVIWKIEGKARGETGTVDSHSSETQEIAGHSILNDEDVGASVAYAIKLLGVKK